MEKKFGLWNSISGPVVMLPQAFGSFDKVGMVDAARRVLGECSNVYARDAKSQQYLTELGTSASIGSCVDITLGVRHEKTISRTDELVLVPNWNLTRVVGRSEYVQTLVGVSRWGAERGMSVVGLLHEGPSDLELLKAVSNEVDIEIVDNESGWQVKERLARARLVVSGRYHAMLGALSSGTPVAVHSWSHKYAAALEAFGVAEWQCDPSDPQVSLDLLKILDAGDFESDLQIRADNLADQVGAMWDEVAKVFLK
ncbi:polysaccharide pyruvyl transferase family protein [Rhodococcus sp. BP-149]|uniref:polysaccharide pyruvyl transferase family protein n=1 Tax=unclassified Rhodococcus (in: high G+C Gram-positive bacteria) TaxID=192944 RepID=UPI001C9A48F1|nr:MULTISPECIES: polysaccharide pyruvyl transferase family protein [unclassified Rhodococcus (in: high G+C Gram-positive bacteria)]MBY6686565.1 polysaccharide pyruvyl transferase family protein [Rhodococcus sp. BP-288]MBY6695275.1 polysaccharide pyruvyl transferase family protein [Rhodococcus sp. BP-188]MBY6700057.1 polysaccharide pyruvyl transferase family protein [Rhodococcus sp. BP-285]MBY6704920.1 polysaccharide pyruvyl transferase family protein [Rhodococcus sp. BP-283]MBY6713182.1 polysa